MAGTAADGSTAGGNIAPDLLSPLAFSMPEEILAAASVSAEDADGDAITYFISGGTDAALFRIDAESGRILFLSASDHEAPVDADGDNVYELTVAASDGLAMTQAAITVTVTDITEVMGTAGDDRLVGGASGDTMDGGAGDDRYVGGGGRDIFLLGAGDQDKVVDFTPGEDRLDVSAWGSQSLEELVITGRAGKIFLHDAVSGDRAVVVEPGATLEPGGVSADMFIFAPVTDLVLTGGAGANALKGRAGDDRLDGRAGADSYWGGGGADTFVIGAGARADKVRDWQEGQDQLDLSSWGLGGMADLILRDRGAGEVAVKDAAGHRLVLWSEDAQFSAAALDAGDFLF